MQSANTSGFCANAFSHHCENIVEVVCHECVERIEERAARMHVLATLMIDDVDGYHR